MNFFFAGGSLILSTGSGPDDALVLVSCARFPNILDFRMCILDLRMTWTSGIPSDTLVGYS